MSFWFRLLREGDYEPHRDRSLINNTVLLKFKLAIYDAVD